MSESSKINRPAFRQPAGWRARFFVRGAAGGRAYVEKVLNSVQNRAEMQKWQKQEKSPRNGWGKVRKTRKINGDVWRILHIDSEDFTLR